MEQLGLERLVKITDFIEENGPAVRRFELADLELMGSGKGAALVPEQFGLQELSRDSRAVDLHERAIPPGG